MAFTFYILFSVQLEKHYIGHTGMALEERLKKHLSEHSGFTGKAKDWKVVYTEEFQNKTEAARREKQVKSWKSATKVKTLYSKI
jgi:putative endonuclease